MPPSPPPPVGTAAIKHLVGGGAFERGRRYQAGGHVLGWTWDRAARRLKGTVEGSARRPYECEVRFHVNGVGRYTVSSTECSCPVGAYCKHVVAVLLDAQQDATRDEGSAETASGTSAPWRGWMRRVVAAPARVPGAEGAEPELALGIQVRERAEGTVLQAKPVRRTQKGTWSKSNDVTWDSVRPGWGYGLGRDVVGRADRRVRSWFADLGDLAGTPYGSGAWRDLGAFGRLLWPLLAEAGELGVPVVGVRRGDEVRVASSSDLALDVLRADAAPGLRVVTSVRFDGEEPGQGSETGALNEHGLFAVTPLGGSRRRITLGPTPDPLTDTQLDALAMPELDVPERDVPEFLTDYYPRLRSRVTVRAADDLELPEAARPVLVCTAVFSGPDRAVVSWSWEYGTGVLARRHAVGDGGGTELRDVAAEARIAAEASAVVRRSAKFAGFRLVRRHEVGGLAVLELGTEVLPALDVLAEVRVETHERPDYTELSDAPVVSVTAGESGDMDWFDLGVAVSVDGREVPLPLLLAALTRGDDRVVLPDGAWLRTDHPSLDRLRELVAEAVRLSDRPGELRLSRYNAGLWGDLTEVADVVEQSESWRRSAEGLLALASGAGDLPDPATEVPLPTGLKAELRPYQRHGYAWLTFLAEHGLGGILADDMGLGKTVQTLAFLARAREGLGSDPRREPGEKPFLVVAPASVVGNWVAEAQRFTPDLRVVALASTPGRLRTSVPEVAVDADVVVTSYAIFRLAHDGFREVDWSGLVLDEAQFAKNHATRTNEVARLLRAPFKLAITGTPLENNLMELWAMLAIVAPGLYRSAGRFREDYVRLVESGARDPELAEEADRAVARLRGRIRPLLLRRTKEQVAPELPERQEQTLSVDLHATHRAVYDRHLQRERSRMLGLLDDFDTNRIAIFRSLTILRRLALDASLVDPAYEGVPSAKLDVLAEQLVEVAAEGHRALVFSQFTSFLGLARERLAAEGVATEYLDGSTTRRTEVIQRFKEGEAPVFLISLKAGGFGVNLTEADYVYLLDPWWNPATEAQAVDRTHRIGQTRNVMVFRMVSAGTIEEKVMALKERKAKLFDAVMNDDGGAFTGGLNVDDIRGLLEEA
ncbi:DEAD/DEAH box helicase [Myceligenerans xiligouense]|uniref:SNF2 family DNA or RNA helicase n=1 Tax=Myceligenerans xiligouense TaxID=253184 RepID=A0A3N4YMZ2_9MICO|nr:DEAD/DEAH box helicase [Myceligenerans xiligouense]RPF22023.1 SNF2 family DNA or RNA helicase [Myceligenerans xiligouense]